jgi:GTP-binding protein EngB required for normal cell division
MKTTLPAVIVQLVEILYQTQMEKAMIVCDQIEAEKNKNMDQLLQENKKLSDRMQELIDQHDSEMNDLLSTVDMATVLVANKNNEIQQLEANLKLSQDHASDLLKEVKNLVAETSTSISGSGYPLLTYALYEKVNDVEST